MEDGCHLTGEEPSDRSCSPLGSRVKAGATCLADADRGFETKPMCIQFATQTFLLRPDGYQMARDYAMSQELMEPAATFLEAAELRADALESAALAAVSQASDDLVELTWEAAYQRRKASVEQTADAEAADLAACALSEPARAPEPWNTVLPLPLDAKPHAVVSAPFDLEAAATGTGDYSPSQSSRSLTEADGLPKDQWDERPEDEGTFPMVSWSQSSLGSRNVVLAPICGDASTPATNVSPVEPIAAVPSVEPAILAPVLGLAPERRSPDRFLRLHSPSRARSSVNCRPGPRRLPGPPFSPRAPFCASQNLFETPGFLWSDLDVVPCDGIVEAEERGEPGELTSFSRANSMVSDCSTSAMISVVGQIPEEEEVCTSERRASKPQCFGARRAGHLASRRVHATINEGEHLAASMREKSAARPPCNIKKMPPTEAMAAEPVTDVWRGTAGWIWQAVATYATPSEAITS